MRSSTVRRATSIMAAAALLASLTTATVATPASAAKPKCAGKVATIVGTNKGELIRGTPKADVIVAKGGHDIIRGGGGNDTICGNRGNDKLVGGGGNDLLFGQAGRDKHFGGPGRDRLVGGPADDRFNGGTGNDACLQGSGNGPRVDCERPAVAPLPVAPPPGPTLLPLTDILVIAYSDIDGLDGYSSGDVLISKIVDTDKSGDVNDGDMIKMGRYPTNLSATAFGDWRIKTHTVWALTYKAEDQVQVTSDIGNNSYDWFDDGLAQQYQEIGPSDIRAVFADGPELDDGIGVSLGSPSDPDTGVPLTQRPPGDDDSFIDVEILY